MYSVPIRIDAIIDTRAKTSQHAASSSDDLHHINYELKKSSLFVQGNQHAACGSDDLHHIKDNDDYITGCVVYNRSGRD